MSHSRRVLIVDDDHGLIEAIADVLSDEGYDPIRAKDGVEALDYLHQAPPPCIILLDWMMPKCDGPTFRSRQLADPQLADIPVALLTADLTLRDKAAALAAVAYLPKPVPMQDLLALVGRFCAPIT